MTFFIVINEDGSAVFSGFGPQTRLGAFQQRWSMVGCADSIIAYPDRVEAEDVARQVKGRVLEVTTERGL